MSKIILEIQINDWAESADFTMKLMILIQEDCKYKEKLVWANIKVCNFRTKFNQIKIMKKDNRFSLMKRITFVFEVLIIKALFNCKNCKQWKNFIKKKVYSNLK